FSPSGTAVAPDTKGAVGYGSSRRPGSTLPMKADPPRTCLFGLLVALAGAAPCARADDLKVLNDDAHFAEGPIWYHGKLYYVEYDRNSVTTWDGARNAVFWSKLGCGPSAVIPTARREFLTTCYDSGSIGRISADGKD